MKPDDQYEELSDASEPWGKWKRRDARARVKALVQQMEDAEYARQRDSQEEINRREAIRRQRSNEKFDPPVDDAALSKRLHLPYSRITEEPGVRSLAVDADEADEPVVEDDGPAIEATSGTSNADEPETVNGRLRP